MNGEAMFPISTKTEHALPISDGPEEGTESTLRTGHYS
jgi:hypothetical protein